jgi:hypothetical protein
MTTWQRNRPAHLHAGQRNASSCENKYNRRGRSMRGERAGQGQRGDGGAADSFSLLQVKLTSAISQSSSTASTWASTSLPIRSSTSLVRILELSSPSYTRRQTDKRRRRPAQKGRQTLRNCMLQEQSKGVSLWGRKGRLRGMSMCLFKSSLARADSTRIPF